MYLDPLDLVGVSFFVVSMALLASTVFFVLKRGDVPSVWRTSLSVAGTGNGYRICSLYVHARRLDRDANVAYGFSLHRLVYHSSAANYRVLLYIAGSWLSKRYLV